MTLPALRVAGLLLLAVCAGRSDAAEPETGAAKLGARVYQERCSPCHGQNGKGDGPVAWAIEPKPRNFTDDAFWQARTPEQLRAVVRNGKPGTQMGAFEGVLSDEEIDAVITYIQTFRPKHEHSCAGAGDGPRSTARARQDAARGAHRRAGCLPSLSSLRPRSR